MKQIIDRERVNRNAMLSNIGSVGGLLMLLLSVLMPLFLPKTTSLSAILMILGLGISMVGIYFANRWVRKPRPEERLDKALKGLSDGYVLFHYPRLAADHILLSPTGVTVLETVNLGGVYSFINGKWKESMTIGRALRYIVEEHLGNPTRAAADSARDLQQKLTQSKDLTVKIPVKAMVVFTHPTTQLDIQKTPVPVCLVEKLRKQVEDSGVKLPPEDYDQVRDYLESVTRWK